MSEVNHPSNCRRFICPNCQNRIRWNGRFILTCAGCGTLHSLGNDPERNEQKRRDRIERFSADAVYRHRPFS
jgi:RNase P subunit RPR2